MRSHFLVKSKHYDISRHFGSLILKRRLHPAMSRTLFSIVWTSLCHNNAFQGCRSLQQATHRPRIYKFARHSVSTSTFLTRFKTRNPSNEFRVREANNQSYCHIRERRKLVPSFSVYFHCLRLVRASQHVRSIFRNNNFTCVTRISHIGSIPCPLPLPPCPQCSLLERDMHFIVQMTCSTFVMCRIVM